MYKHLIPLIIMSIATLVLAEPKHKQPKGWRVTKSVLSGNTTFSTFELKNVIELKTEWFKQRPRYTGQKVQADSAALSQFYIQQGFLSARITPTVVHRDSARLFVSLKFLIDEGVRCTFADVHFSGWTPDSTLVQKMKCTIKKPLVQKSIRHDEQLFKSVHRENGHLFAAVLSKQVINTAKDSCKITFFTSKGPCILADSVEIEGVKALKPIVIQRELTLKRGDTIATSALKKIERNLYRTNLVNAVSLEPVIHDSAQLMRTDSLYTPLRASIKESNFFKLKLGVGYSSEEDARGALEMSYSNLFRLGHRIALKGNISPLLQQVQTVYSTPWFLGFPLRFDGKLYFNRFNNKDTYNGGFRGFNLALERQTDLDFTVQLTTRFEDVIWITAKDLPEKYPKANTQSIGVNLFYDTRNDLLDPESGIYHLWSFEFAGLTGSNSNQFTKITNDSRVYWQLGWLKGGSGLKLGWVVPFEKTAIIPLQDQFYAGGSKSVRGFRDNFLLYTTDSTRHALSGTILATANIIEMRFPLFWVVGGAVFLDAGYLAAGAGTVNLSSVKNDVRFSAGPGLRITTPLAILRADFGVKVSPRPGEEPWQFHFDVGQSF